uniref:RING-CH-type domain-containing protein n=1 Tax=Pinguiococcus pyrenoidosus TaxID=172671 RepID=A0A7R9U7Z2_9STRA|mmetsp:Transcript_16769/g.63773  ORF Transcript_16769/g.63773 Transcript_16769/m.63773 type:complete len:585 (+) Transcript_16769:274-2028(+)
MGAAIAREDGPVESVEVEDGPLFDASLTAGTALDFKISYSSNQKYKLPEKQNLRCEVAPVVLRGMGHTSEQPSIADAFESKFGTHVTHYSLGDPKNYELLVAPSEDGYWLLPSAEAFSRHTGTCVILGDRRNRTITQRLGVGDCFRLGSVGLVVSEIHTGGEDGHEIMSQGAWDYLRNDLEHIEMCVPAHTPARRRSAGSKTGTEAEANGYDTEDEADEDFEQESGDAPICYICFDGENTEDNPLVAPCQCRGDTQYLHLNCLQKWYETNEDSHVCAVYTTTGTQHCPVCKAKYKTHAKLQDGRIISLRRRELAPPYICFIVVTKHDAASVLFQTRFQLSFASVMSPDGTEATRELTIGRSHNCDMPLDYRTISVRHASVSYSQRAGFQLQDLRSSNGTLMYLQSPWKLPMNRTTSIRVGRATINVKPSSSLWHRLRGRGRRASGVDESVETERSRREFEQLKRFTDDFMRTARKRRRESRKGDAPHFSTSGKGRRKSNRSPTALVELDIDEDEEKPVEAPKAASVQDAGEAEETKMVETKAEGKRSSSPTRKSAGKGRVVPVAPALGTPGESIGVSVAEGDDR